MIIVSNTSPLTNLAAIGQFDLLYRLYARLHIAEGVWDELNAQGKRWPGRDEVAAADWIERYAVQNQTLITVLQRDLDRASIIRFNHPLGTGWPHRATRSVETPR